jgi:hypothetical protein
MAWIKIPYLITVVFRAGTKVYTAKGQYGIATNLNSAYMII